VLLWSSWRQSRKDVRHSGDKVDQVSDKVDRDKLSNQIVADLLPKPATKSTAYGDSRDFVADLSPVSATVDFQ